MKKTAVYIFLLAFFVAMFSVPVSAADVEAIESGRILASYIGGCEEARSLPAMVAVGAVILNRCGAESFPGTVSANGAALGILPTASPPPMAEYAARLALSGLDPTFGALVFYRSDDVPKGSYITFSVPGLSVVK